MKTIYRLLVLFLMLTSIWGCVKTELVEEISNVELTASMEYEAETRTSLSGLENGMYYPLWSADDEIAVFADGDSEPSRFTLNSGEGTTVASFTGSRQGDEYVAIYPYDMADNMSDGIISLTLPQTQKYVPDSFGQNAFPMLAVGGSDGMLKFMNLCSVLKISLTGRAAIRSITVSANDKDTYLSGPALVNAAASMDYLTMTEGASNTVVLECKGAKIEETPDFHIVIPSQTYKGGLTLEIDAYTDTITKIIDTDLVFERSQIRMIKDFELNSEVPDIIPEAIPDNEIWYTTTDGNIVIPYATNVFGANIISNVYKGDKGVITFDGRVTEIGRMAFANLNGRYKESTLKSIYIPQSVDKIGISPFYWCVNLECVYLPNKLSDVANENPFSGCMKLKEFHTDLASDDKRCLIIDSELVAFAPYEISEYTTPAGVERIGAYAFSHACDLRKIVISEGVKSIEGKAFSACSEDKVICEFYDHYTSLEEVYLPASLTEIGGYTFHLQYNIKKFYGTCKFVSDDGYSLIVEDYYKGKTYLVNFASGAGLTEYIIPEGVEAIESYAFYKVESLNELTFPSTLSGIESSAAFEGTYNIERIFGPSVLDDNRSLVVDGTLLYVAPKNLIHYTTPPGVSKISYEGLADKPEMESVVISDEVVTVVDSHDGLYGKVPLGYILQQNPNLKTVTISANMRILGNDPLGSGSGWGESLNVETVYLRARIPPIIDHNFPEKIPALFPNLTIYVPNESLSTYLNSLDWAPYRGYFKGYNYTDLPENDTYVSSDYSNDGSVTTLQTATKGNGIDIVLMGDAYSDRQITDGTYKADMENLYNNLFTEEPYKSFKDLFNVYYINVVSVTEGYEHRGAALGGFFGNGTYVGGNDNAVFDYALNAISEAEMNEALIIVAMNSDAYAGTCYMYYPSDESKDYGSGASVAYFPKGSDKAMFAQLLHHEACGHGFAKLADEYYYSGTIPDAEITNLKNQNSWGWWKNTDFTSDTSQVKWAKFLDDERYAGEGLGVFEGAHTYEFGAYRPTEESIMKYNIGGFNAPSREAIYYRIHKLAYGDDWEYDYEKFVEYDAINRISASATAPQKRRANYVEKQYEPLPPPVVVGKTWREASNN